MSKHTKGPWKVWTEKNLDDRRTTLTVRDNVLGKRLAEVFTGLNDARLIAAAPEMLWALKVVLAALEKPLSEDTIHGTVAGVRQIIAQAEGGDRE